jgi:hypothetical protein
MGGAVPPIPQYAFMADAELEGAQRTALFGLQDVVQREKWCNLKISKILQIFGTQNNNFCRILTMVC